MSKYFITKYDRNHNGGWYGAIADFLIYIFYNIKKTELGKSFNFIQKLRISYDLLLEEEVADYMQNKEKVIQHINFLYMFYSGKHIFMDIKSDYWEDEGYFLNNFMHEIFQNTMINPFSWQLSTLASPLGALDYYGRAASQISQASFHANRGTARRDKYEEAIRLINNYLSRPEKYQDILNYSYEPVIIHCQQKYDSLPYELIEKNKTVNAQKPTGTKNILKHLEKSIELGKNLKELYEKLLTYSRFETNIDFSINILSTLYFMSDYYLYYYCKNKEEYLNFFPEYIRENLTINRREIVDGINKRFNVFYNVVEGKSRVSSYWTNQIPPTNTIINICIIILGDLLYNPSCINNYTNTNIPNEDELMRNSFGEKYIEIIPFIKEYKNKMESIIKTIKD